LRQIPRVGDAGSQPDRGVRSASQISSFQSCEHSSAVTIVSAPVTLGSDDALPAPNAPAADWLSMLTPRIARNEVILVADADPDARQIYSAFLQHHGFHVVAVTTGRDALAVAPAVDAVVTEIPLPGEIDGLELISRLKGDARTTAIPRIVVSSRAWSTDRDRATGAGCDLFLSKPCLPHDLMDSINRLLARRRRRDRTKTIAPPTRRPDRLDRQWRPARRGRTESAARDSHGQRALREVSAPWLRR
jgi:two-component system, cell cycle response regulator DivK